ncbi:MAG: dUTP diphosphatase [Chitinophagales bacterium]|nr:dUTP diphosphatase [Hyphomicrobiales bacterium]
MSPPRPSLQAPRSEAVVNPGRKDAIQVTIKILPHGESLDAPLYQSALAAGFDIAAALPNGESVTLQPGERRLIPTGFAMELPPGYEAQVRPRSGLAMRHGVTVLNAPGTIDADYRGEVKALLVNLGKEPYIIERGTRIAQIVIQSVVRADLSVATQLTASVRGEGGFGSTGS